MNLEDYWDGKEIDRELFIALLKDNEDPTHYMILRDGNFVMNLYLESNEQARDYFRNTFLKKGVD